MATPLLGLALPTTGSLTGAWGDTVNNSITSLLDSAVAGTTTLSSDLDVTLTTTQEAANQAREAILLWTASGTTTRYITAPAQSKSYIVINASSTQSIVLRGAGPTTGVTITAGEKALCAWNGSDFVKVSTTTATGVTSVTATSPVASTGGTTPVISLPAATTSANGYLTSTDWNTFNGKQSTIALTTVGTGGAATLVGSTLNIPNYSAGSSGVSTISVASSNGFSGSSSGGSTPILTLQTTVTGIVKGSGGTLISATSGTDYAPATSGSSILYGNSSGGFSNVVVGSGLNFSSGTLTATGGGSGTVTSVGGTGTVNGITLSGTVTSTGNLTLGGALSGVSLTSQVSGTLPVANGGTGATASTGSGSVVLATSPTITTPSIAGGNLTFTASNGGVVFNKSGALVNSTLNDYEEGTWTPTFNRISSAPTVSYAAQQGRYTKIGRLVYLSCYLSTISQSGGSGVYYIGGLPFLPSLSEQEQPGGSISNFNGITLPASATQLTLDVNNPASTGQIYFIGNYNNGTTAVTMTTGIASSFTINFSCMYNV